MAKATLTLANGTKAQIEGSASEVKELLEAFSTANGHSNFGETASKKRRKTSGKKMVNKDKRPQKTGPVGLVRELIDENYFKTKKISLGDIQKKLEERGHIYAQTSLSPALMRLVRSKELRRVHEKKGWAYTT